MKVTTPELRAHLGQEVTTTCTLLTIDRLDGVSFHFTDREEGLEYQGDWYEPYVGYIPSALETKINMSVDNQTITGALEGVGITKADIRAGLFDFANVELEVVNYEDTSMLDLPMISGKFGENILGTDEFQIELRGVAQLLQQTMGETYSVQCKATLGDARCKVDLSNPDYTKSFTVTGVVAGNERRAFQTDLVDADGYFNAGFVTFSATPGSSANPGAKMDVKGYLSASGEVELYEPLAYAIAINDLGTIVVGCARSLDACKTYNNVVNHRGKPYLKGMSFVIRGPN